MKINQKTKECLYIALGLLAYVLVLGYLQNRDYEMAHIEYTADYNRK